MWQKLSKLLKLSFVIIAVIAIISFWSAISYFSISKVKELLSKNENVDTTETTASTTENTEDCNVYGINIHGSVVTYNGNDSYNESGKLKEDQTSSDDVYWIIKTAESDENIKAVIVEIDSGGGSGVAGEEMMTAFKNSTKPVVVYIRNRGTSAAYLAATGAQTIFASKFSDIGSIGVTASYLENVDKNKKEGLKFIELSAGKYKDTFNPDRPLTADEKRLIMRDINLSHEYFIQIVAQNRKMDVGKVKQFADGSTIMGETALKNKLIDKIGNIYDVENFLKEKINEDTKICWKN